MKKTTPTKIIAIYAEDKKGLLGEILMILNRSNYPVHQLNAARTDIDNIVLITLEVTLPDSMLPTIMLRIEKIVEVYKTKGYMGMEAEMIEAGHYLIAKDFVDAPFFALLQKHGAMIAGITADAFVIQKTGTANDLQVFYRALEGPQLINYCKSGLIVTNSLTVLDELYK
jgi:acetolactate synthase small subunit